MPGYDPPQIQTRMVEILRMCDIDLSNLDTAIGLPVKSSGKPFMEPSGDPARSFHDLEVSRKMERIAV